MLRVKIRLDAESHNSDFPTAPTRGPHHLTWRTFFPFHSPLLCSHPRPECGACRTSTTVPSTQKQQKLSAPAHQEENKSASIVLAAGGGSRSKSSQAERSYDHTKHNQNSQINLLLLLGYIDTFRRQPTRFRSRTPRGALQY